MTYDKAMFILLSGIFVMMFLVLCIIGKLFFLTNMAIGLVVYQIGLLGYAVVLTLFDSKSISNS